MFITNTVKCRPTKKGGKINRPPNESEILACKSWLWQEIQLVKPQIIVTLGKTPTYTLLHKQLNKKFRLGDIIGVKYIVDYCDSRIVPCWHPSFLMLHGRKHLDLTVNLFKEIKTWLR